MGGEEDIIYMMRWMDNVNARPCFAAVKQGPSSHCFVFEELRLYWNFRVTGMSIQFDHAFAPLFSMYLPALMFCIL